MSQPLQVAVTSLANIGGYTTLFVVIVALVAALDRRSVGRIPAAALALFGAWIITTCWYVATEYWVGSYTVNTTPEWLEATNGIAENIQSEVIQIWIAALVFAHLLWPGSPDSKERVDTDDASAAS